MEHLKQFELENTEMILGGTLIKTYCPGSNKVCDAYDDELDRIIYL
jgi:hypothetical protein|nr:hypothetical protein [Allomuricauda sp.]